MNKKGGVFKNWLAGLPAPAYLLYGDGAGLAGLLVKEWESKLRAEGVSCEISRWTMMDMDGESPTLAWRSPSFFSRARIFVLPDLAEMKKAHRDELKSYLAAPEPSATLVLHGTDFRQAKTFSTAPNLSALALREDQAIDALAGYAVDMAKEAGVSLSRESAAFLAKFAGGIFEALDVELLKLFAFVAGKDAVAEEDIRSICVFRGEVNSFQLAEALERNDAAATLSMLRQFAKNAKDDDYHQLTGALAWSLRERVQGRKGSISVERAAKLFDVLSKIDREIKGESRLSPRQVYEIRLLSVLT